jgi:hypothetical protein
LVFAIVITLSLFFLAGNVFAQGQANVTYLKGEPKIMKARAAGWEDCKVGMAIGNGDHIKTMEKESVEISFLGDKSNIVNIEEGSDVVVKKNDAPYSVELMNGAVVALIKKLPAKSTFEITTPIGTCGARGTGWRSSTDADRSRFEAFENKIYVKGIDRSGKPMGGELIVDSGWSTTLNKFEAPEKLERLSAGDMEKWNSWKNELDDRARGSEKTAERIAEKVLDKAGKTESRIESLESVKSDVRETQDNTRVESVLEGQAERNDQRSTGGGNNNNYNINR